MGVESQSQMINGVSLLRIAPNHYRAPNAPIDVVPAPAGGWKVVEQSGNQKREFHFEDLEDAASFVKSIA